MMEKLRNPKNVKTISLIVAAIFVIGCFTLAMSAYTGDERRRVWQRRSFCRVQ